MIPRGLGAVVRLGGPEDGPEAGLVSEARPAGGGRWVSRMAAQRAGRPGPGWSQAGVAKARGVLGPLVPLGLALGPG